MKKVYLLFAAIFAVSTLQAQFFNEDFDGANTTYPVSLSQSCNDNVTDYFGIVCLLGGACGNEVGAAVQLNGVSGSFLGAQDTNGAPCTSSIQSATWDDIDISSCMDNLYICFDIAEDDDGSNQDWDSGSRVSVNVDFDNSGSLSEVIAFAGSGSNTEPQMDTDCDGVGDGAAVTNTFTTYCFELSSIATSLDIVIDIEGLNDGDEDVAIDNLALYCGVDESGLPVLTTPACFVAPPSCSDPVPGGSCDLDMQIDMSSVAEVDFASVGFHNSIMDCGANENYTPAYGELADDGDGDAETGIITGLFDEAGSPVSATYEVGHVNVACSGNCIESLIPSGNGSISNGSVMQAGSPKPTLFNTHYTENIGIGGLIGLSITFSPPVNNFGIYLGDWETSSQGLLGEVWVFDDNGNLLCADVMDPVFFGPISSEGGCGAGQGDQNCGNETTTWVEVTNPSAPIGSVCLVLGDDDSCMQTSACDGLTEHISFGGVTVGGECAPTLPVELVEFTASLAEEQVQLKWMTAVEINNAHFDVERSVDGRAYETVATVQGRGTTYDQQQYSLVDRPDLSQGIIYYRLKQVDTDGSYAYIGNASVRVTGASKLIVYPSAASDFITVQMPDDHAASQSIQIMDVLGGTYKLETTSTGSGRYNLDVSGLPMGQYLIVVPGVITRYTCRFLKL